MNKNEDRLKKLLCLLTMICFGCGDFLPKKVEVKHDVILRGEAKIKVLYGRLKKKDKEIHRLRSRLNQCVSTKYDVKENK